MCSSFSSRAHPYPPSFPTRRSSDLPALHDVLRQAPEVLEQYHAQADGNGPELADRQRLHSLEGELWADRKSTRLNSSHTVISYAVCSLKEKTKKELANPLLTGAPPG